MGTHGQRSSDTHNIAPNVFLDVDQCIYFCRRIPDATGCEYYSVSDGEVSYCRAIKGWEVEKGYGDSAYTCWKLKSVLS